MSKKQNEEKCKLVKIAENADIKDDAVLKCTAGQLRAVIANSSKGLLNLDFGSEAKQQLADAEKNLVDAANKILNLKASLQAVLNCLIIECNEKDSEVKDTIWLNESCTLVDYLALELDIEDLIDYSNQLLASK